MVNHDDILDLAAHILNFETDPSGDIDEEALEQMLYDEFKIEFYHLNRVVSALLPLIDVGPWHKGFGVDGVWLVKQKC